MNVPEARTRLLVLFVILLVLDISAVALLLSPVGRSRSARGEEYMRVRQQLQAKRRESLPARDMDKKLAMARAQINQFYADRLPSRYADISAELGKLANENGIQIAGIQYVSKDAEIEGLQRVTIDAALTGDYAKEMKFINSIERNKLFFVLKSVALENEKNGAVRLQLKFETFLRTA